MKKWIGLYIGLFLTVLLICGGVGGVYMTKQMTEYGMLCQEGGYLSQVVEVDGIRYVLYQNPEEKKFQMINTEKEGREPVGTVHQNGVYSIFQYTDGEQQFFGAEPLGILKPEKEQQEAQLPVFTAQGEFLAAGSDEKALFCSILGEDGRTITEYMWLTGSEGWQERQSLVFPKGHFVLCGAYQQDMLWLADEAGTVYTYSMVLQETELKVEETILAGWLQRELAPEAENVQLLYASGEAAKQFFLLSLLIAGMAVLVLYGMSRQNHIVFRILCCTELLCVVVLLYANTAATAKLILKEVLETGIEAGHVLEEMKSSQRADGTVKPEHFWYEMEQREGLLEDLLILDAESGEVRMAKTLPAGTKIGVQYDEEEAADVLAAVKVGKEAIMTKLKKGGMGIYTVAMRDWTDRNPDTVSLAVISEQGIQKSVAGLVNAMKTGMYLLLAGVTIVHGLLFVYFTNIWKKFREGIVFVAQEKKAYPDTPKHADGLQEAWMPLVNIGDTLSRLYYERDLLYRGYYKFVPKGMDRLLKKPILADIEVGDRAEIRGCMVNMVLGDQKQLDSTDYFYTMTKSMELLHRVREQREGIFLSASADLQERKVFFEQDAESALQFSIDLLHAYAENSLLMESDLILLLHTAEFQYGISGVKDMMTPYMYSAQESVLYPYAKDLAEAKVRIVLTGQTLSLVGGQFDTRYIGFIADPAGGNAIKLYECLDAYPEGQRRLMQQTDAMFQSGLDLLYSNDFYLARNTFNEVLKLNEMDYIARWYLFHCEYHLNYPDAEVFYGLFETDVSEEYRGR